MAPDTLGGLSLNDPVQIFTAITLIALPTVMFGGFSLPRLLIGGRLNEFQLTYFRAGHAHTGVCWCSRSSCSICSPILT